MTSLRSRQLLGHLLILLVHLGVTVCQTPVAVPANPDNVASSTVSPITAPAAPATPALGIPVNPSAAAPAVARSSANPSSGASVSGFPVNWATPAVADAPVAAVTPAPALQQPVASNMVPVASTTPSSNNIAPGVDAPSSQNPSAASGFAVAATTTGPPRPGYASQTSGAAAQQSSQLSAAPTSPANNPQPSAIISSSAAAGGSMAASTMPNHVNSASGMVQPSSALFPVASSLAANTPAVRTWPVTGLPTLLPTTPLQLGLDIYHCQLLFSNDYELTLNVSGVSSSQYAADLSPVIAAAVGINVARVTDVALFKYPNTSALLVRFDVRPALPTCQLDCRLTPKLVVEKIRNLTIEQSFNLTDGIWPTSQKLFPSQPPAFAAWTDTGPCPNASCDETSTCECRQTGELYCQCLDVMNCPTLAAPAAAAAAAPVYSSNEKLWALIVIPIVLIIVLIAVLAVLIRLRLIKLPVKRKIGPTVRNYKPAYDIGTIVNHPMLATLDPGAANRLYKTLNSNLGISFHDKSFQDNGSDSSSSIDAGNSPFGAP